jgi:signal transduction histidine kinase
MLTKTGPYSLRHRIVAVVLTAICLVWLVLGFTVYHAVLRASAVEFDERLVQQALVIAASAEHEYLETGQVVSKLDESAARAAEPEFIYQIWTRDGRLIHRTAAAPRTALASLGITGFNDVRLPDGTWRSYSAASSATPIVVQVAEPIAHRAMIANRVWSAVRVPVLVALPILAALIYWLTSIAFAALDRFALTISARSPRDLTPLQMRELPVEVHPLGVAVNELLARQAEVLARETRFTADAAHELRTPLSAVRAQAQVALRATTREETSVALTRLIAGIDRASRLLTQLLSLARLEHGAGSGVGAARAIDTVVRSVINDLAPLANARKVTIDFLTETSDSVPEEPIYLLTRNLLDNAIQHAPTDTVVTVEIKRIENVLRLRISDRGPGVPEELRAKLFEPFHRETRAYSGSGLGLSIVSRVATLFGGQVDLASTSDAQGLSVTVSLPLPRVEVAR